MAMTTAQKVRENRARRVAERQGLTLMKSRRKDPMALDYGRFWLSDPHASNVVIIGDEWGAELDEVEQYLAGVHPNISNPRAGASR